MSLSITKVNGFCRFCSFVVYDINERLVCIANIFQLIVKLFVKQIVKQLIQASLKFRSKLAKFGNCFIVTILATIIDACIVSWRAPKEKHNSNVMITYQHKKTNESINFQLYGCLSLPLCGNFCGLCCAVEHVKNCSGSPWFKRFWLLDYFAHFRSAKLWFDDTCLFYSL